MYKDPIVDEVRRAGLEIQKECNDDLHTFFEYLKRAEGKYANKSVRKSSKERRIRAAG